MRLVMQFVATAAVGILGSASAETLSIPLSNGELATTVGGRSCVVLPMEAPAVPGNISLGEVRLRLPRVELDAQRDVTLYVRLLTSSRYVTDDDLDEELVGRLSVAAGGTLRDVDLGNLLRGVLEGRAMHGLVVTTPDARGFELADATAVLAAFEQGALEVSFRGAPPAPAPRG
jgi:hypothetical protein